MEKPARAAGMHAFLVTVQLPRASSLGAWLQTAAWLVQMCRPPRRALAWQRCGRGRSLEAGPQLTSGGLHHHGSTELQWRGKTRSGGSVWVLLLSVLCVDAYV